MSLFANLNPVFLTLGVGGVLAGRDNKPLLWNGTIPECEAILRYDDLLTSEWDPAGVMAYITRLEDAAASANKLGLAATGSDRIAAFISRQGAAQEANTYYNRRMGRLGFPLTGAFHFCGQVDTILRVAKNHGWGSGLELRRIIAAQMEEWRTSLDGLYNGTFGPKSIGYFSDAERTGVLRSLDAMMSWEMYAELGDLWTKAGGSLKRFNPLFRKFYVLNTKARRRFDAHAAPESPVPHGEETVAGWFQGWGLIDTVPDILELLAWEERLLRKEMAGIAPHRRDADLWVPQDDKEILLVARRERRRYVTSLGEMGLGDIFDLGETGRIPMSIMKPDQRGGAELASANGHQIVYRPAEERATWLADEGGFRRKVWHEMTHILQGRQKYVPATLTGMLANEGGATAAEYLRLLTTENTRAVYAFLRGGLQRAVTLKIAILFHLGRIPPEGVVTALIGTEIDPERAVKVAGAIMANLSYLGQYTLGEWFWVALLKSMSGDVRVAFQRLAREGGLIVPGHVLIPGIDPFRFNLRAHLPEVPMRVQIARELIR